MDESFKSQFKHFLIVNIGTQLRGYGLRWFDNNSSEALWNYIKITRKVAYDHIIIKLKFLFLFFL